MFECGGEAGLNGIHLKPENWGRDVARQPLQHPFTSLSSSVQTNLTSDSDARSINTKRWLEKIKKLAELDARPLPHHNEDENPKKSCY